MKAEYKLVIIGEGGVGKSALTIRFVQDYFIEEYDPTIEDSYRRQVKIDNEICILDILDTAGEEEYSAMRDQYYREGEGFLLVFSISSRRSFDESIKYYKQVTKAKDTENIPLLLVGNKCDLEIERQVNNEEIEELREIIGCQYFESSAKDRINVDEIFYEIVREINKFGGPKTIHKPRNRKN